MTISRQAGEGGEAGAFRDITRHDPAIVGGWPLLLTWEEELLGASVSLSMARMELDKLGIIVS